MTSNQVGYQAASLLIVIWLLMFLAPSRLPFRFCAVGKPAWMPVFAAGDHGWPIAATYGQDRSEGMPSLSEAPHQGQRARYLGLFQ